MDQQVSMPTVSMGGSYPPNAASGLPPWTSSGEGLRALYEAQQSMPAMIQHSGEPRYPSHPDPTVMTTSRKKSPATKTRKRKSRISSNNARTSIICAQGDATTVPMMNYTIPNSSGFMMPDIDGSLTMPHQPITTMHNPSYLSRLPPSSMPQDHSQVVSACLAAQHPTQQLSHLTHPPVVVGIATSAATSMALPMPPAPTQLSPLTAQGLHWGGPDSGCSDTRSTIQWTPSVATNTSSTMVNKPSSSEELCPPTPIPEIPDDLTDADWNEIITQGSTSGHTPKKAQAAQPVPPVSHGGVLSSNSHNIACSASYCPQQVAQTIQNQKVVAPASTQELEQIQTAQQPQGVGVLSQNNILASTNQAPPQVAGNSPLPCMNTSEGHSSPGVPTLGHHHPDTNSSNDGSSLTTVGVPTSTTQGSAITNSSIVTQKSDQLPVCASPNHNQSDQSARDDDGTDSCCKPAQVCYSPTNPMSDPEIIEKMESDLHMCYKELKSSHQYFHRKRTSTTAGLENENENETTHTCKNARKDSGGDDSLVRFILLNMVLKQQEMYEQMKNMNEQLHDVRTLLSGLRPSQQVKMKGAVKTETQNNCMIHAALKEESNGIRLQDCCWKDENLLKIEGDDPCQFGRNLIEKLFPVEDRIGKCYRRGPRMSKKELLDEQRVKILDACIKYRFGPECFSTDFVNSLNQKCRDAMKKIKKECH